MNEQPEFFGTFCNDPKTWLCLVFSLILVKSYSAIITINAANKSNATVILVSGYFRLCRKKSTFFKTGHILPRILPFLMTLRQGLKNNLIQCQTVRKKLALKELEPPHLYSPPKFHLGSSSVLLTHPLILLGSFWRAEPEKKHLHRLPVPNTL